MKLFSDLSPEEAEKFRQWARKNYIPFTEIKGIWYPVVQMECVKINQESSDRFPDLELIEEVFK